MECIKKKTEKTSKKSRTKALKQVLFSKAKSLSLKEMFQNVEIRTCH